MNLIPFVNNTQAMEERTGKSEGNLGIGSREFKIE
jgi:hypothetical protein